MPAGDMEFYIPQHPLDLEGQLPVGRFGVASVTAFDEGAASAEEVLDTLLERVLNSKDIFATVLDHAVFDQAYSLLKCVPHPAARFPCPRGARARPTSTPHTAPCPHPIQPLPPSPLLAPLPSPPGGGPSTAAM